MILGRPAAAPTVEKQSPKRRVRKEMNLIMGTTLSRVWSLSESRVLMTDFLRDYTMALDGVMGARMSNYVSKQSYLMMIET